jgi:hypothetical protein
MRTAICSVQRFLCLQCLPHGLSGLLPCSLRFDCQTVQKKLWNTSLLGNWVSRHWRTSRWVIFSTAMRTSRLAFLWWLQFWHVYVLVGAYFVWPLKSCEPHRIRDVTPGSLSATDTCIVYHVTHFEASRNVILHTRYVSTCVGALVVVGVGKQWTKAIRCGACYYSIAGCGRGREKCKRIPFIFNDESAGSCICLRLDLYMIRYFHH